MEAAVNDVLVSIDRHALDESIPIPYVGVRGPLSGILMPAWQVRNIIELGTFSVRFAPTPADEPSLRTPEPEPVPAPVHEVQPDPAHAVVPDATSEPEGVMTPDEVIALRDRILALSTVKSARALAVEFGIELPPAATRLEDLRAALLAPVEAALSAE